MPGPEVTYVKLPDYVGVAPAFIRTTDGLEVENPRAGELDPLNNVGVTIPVPTMVGGEVVNDSRRVQILPAAEPVDTDAPTIDAKGRLLAARIVPDTRVVESGHPAITALLLDAGYLPCDPPEATRPRRQRNTTTNQGA